MLFYFLWADVRTSACAAWGSSSGINFLYIFFGLGVYMLYFLNMDSGEIKALLKKLGIKHKWIADKVGLSPAYFSMMINGHRTPPPGFSKSILNILKQNEELLRELKKEGVRRLSYVYKYVAG